MPKSSDSQFTALWIFPATVTIWMVLKFQFLWICFIVNSILLVEPAASPVRASNVEEVHETFRTVFLLEDVIKCSRLNVHYVVVKLVEPVMRKANQVGEKLVLGISVVSHFITFLVDTKNLLPQNSISYMCKFPLFRKALLNLTSMNQTSSRMPPLLLNYARQLNSDKLPPPSRMNSKNDSAMF